MPGISSAAKCVECSPGRFGTDVGSPVDTSCTDCDVGTFTDFSGATACKPCVNATVTLVGRGATYCSTCPAGKAKSGQACQLCPPSFYAEAASLNCTQCLAGSYVNAEQSGCVPCPPGKHGLGRGASSEAEGCRDCPVGTYSEAQGIDARDKCIKCPLGEFSNISGSYFPSCKRCPEGSFASSYGSANCTECTQEGTYCAAGATKVRTVLEYSLTLFLPFNLHFILLQRKTSLHL